MFLIFLFIPFLLFIILFNLGFILTRKGFVFINFYWLIIHFILGLFLIYLNVFDLLNIHYTFEWINIKYFYINWDLKLDFLTASMFFLILIVSNTVQIYSFYYMYNDPHIIRFFSYLSLFVFFMFILITSGNFLQLFLGWEGVGLSSFLLITFWYTRLEAVKSGLKAFFINKIGDMALLISICLLFNYFYTLNFDILFFLIPFFLKIKIYIFFFEVNLITLICFFLFIGVMSKSAQIGLHGWLPDAMEGPTPVSALIHAATMVTAGVFLLIRCSFLFEFSEIILNFITIIGLLTSLFSASIGIFQYDLKKIIAYSTCSQLGYMVFICGLSNYNIALFHLINHGFFKALLFLSAGSIIHSLNNEQDIRKMGGLFKLMPITFIFFILGSYSLLGFPFFSGFFSKDLIIELTFGSFKFSNLFFYFLSILAAIFTLFYSLRLLYYVFFIESNISIKKFFLIHETPFFFNLFLSILAILSIISGFFLFDLYNISNILNFNLNLYISYNNNFFFQTEQLHFFIKLIPLFILIFFLNFFYYIENKLIKFYLKFISYNVRFYFPFEMPENKKWFKYEQFNRLYLKKIFIFFMEKWFFDSLINFSTLKSHKLSWILNYYFDKGTIEFFGPLFFLNFFIKKKNNLNYILNEFFINYFFLVIYFFFLFLIVFINFFLHLYFEVFFYIHLADII